eukprot:COSAG03_NODE_17302_length_379_cov_0.546429_1_plen_74_part_01
MKDREFNWHPSPKLHKYTVVVSLRGDLFPAEATLTDAVGWEEELNSQENECSRTKDTRAARLRSSNETGGWKFL